MMNEDQELSDRRLEDRREFPEGKAVRSRWAFGRRLVTPIMLITVGVLVWHRRLVMHAPVWVARAYRADRSDLYLGRTNGISNRGLVLQARNYLKDIDHQDASGNITTPEALLPLGGHLDIAWFMRHASESVEFNPFVGPHGSFIVSWLYVPGCQKAVWKSARTDTDWYSLRGRPCTPLCRLSVLMAPDLRFNSIALSPVQS